MSGHLTKDGVSNPILEAPRALGPRWKMWMARLLGLCIETGDSGYRMRAYFWRGTLYVWDWFPPDANFYHEGE